MKNFLLTAGSVFLLMSVVSSHNAFAWSSSPGDQKASRHLEGAQINLDNVGRLQKLWRFDSGFSLETDTVQSTPIYTGTAVITVNLSGDVVALQPEDAEVLWRRKLDTPVARRGMTYVAERTGDGGQLFIPTGKGVVRMDGGTGEIVQIYASGMSLVQPIVVNNRLYVATRSEGIIAFDIPSGDLIWQRKLEFIGVKTGRLSATIWSGFSFDAKSNLLFVTTGDPDKLTGHFGWEDNYSVSLIAVRANNGDIAWRYQHVVQDIWDLDLVGHPMIVHGVQIVGVDDPEDVVVGLSKTGEVIVLRVADGQPALADSILVRAVDAAPTDDVTPTALVQNEVVWPRRVSDTVVDRAADFSHLSGDNAAYVAAKLRHAQSGRYLPTSIDYDVLMYGLHGGPEWPGGAIYSSEGREDLLVPFNRYPWLLRIKHIDNSYETWEARMQRVERIAQTWEKLTNWLSDCWHQPFGCSDNADQEGARTSNKISRWGQQNWHLRLSQTSMIDRLYTILPGSISHPEYQTHCSECHGVARQGHYQSELYGDGYYPSLVGIHFSKKWEKADTPIEMKEIHRMFDINLNVDDQMYVEMMNYYKDMDNAALADGRLSRRGFWQLLLDKDGFPATKSPWGGVANVSLRDGLHRWIKPFGVRPLGKKQKAVIGDISFGGVMTTSTGVGFATGTPDKMIRAFDLNDGKLLWEEKLPYAGSAPPMGFRHRGCDIIVVVATGGRFVGFLGNGDSTIAFKLEDCTFK